MHQSNPWIRLYQAFIRISKWDYESAYQILNNLIQTEKSSNFPIYQLKVVQVNLLASQIVTERWREANETLADLESSLDQPEFGRLRQNLKELKLQMYVGEKKYTQALELLSRHSVQELQGPEKLYYLKWKLIIESLSQSNFPMDDYHHLRALASEKKHWEVVRDLDARFALHTKNVVFLKRVLYSSQSFYYRKSLLSQFGTPVLLEPTFNYRFWSDGNDDSKVRDRRFKARWLLDVVSGEFLKDKQIVLTLKKGQMAHRLIGVLSSDLYRSHTVGSIFSKLFPSEFYNPITSHNRVHQAIKQVRHLLEASQIPLMIESIGSAFRLKTEDDFELCVPLEFAPGKLQNNLTLIKNLFEDRMFDVEDVVRVTNQHPKAVQRLLRSAVEEGLVAKMGRGRSTKYYFNSMPNKRTG